MKTEVISGLRADCSCIADTSICLNQDVCLDHGVAGYRAATDESRSLGIFGSPTFMAGNELFWGDDRLEDAISWHQTGVVA